MTPIDARTRASLAGQDMMATLGAAVQSVTEGKVTLTTP